MRHQLNLQPPSNKLPDSSGEFLEIAGLPFSTIQGEGPFAGDRATFVRLAGCNLQCPDCDTDYTSKVTRVAYQNVSEVISKMPARLIVITGGEPFRQDIGPFVRDLITRNRDSNPIFVQIETNGTYYRSDFPWYIENLSVVCSPKTGSINLNLLPHITTYKYVLESGYVDPEDGLPTSVLGNGMRVARPRPGFRKVVYVQPADQQNEEANKANLDACVQSCLKFGYRLGHQLHKLIGMP